MSGNKKGSPTDPQQIEERFAEVFLDAFLSDTSSKYDPDRPLDLSFLKEEDEEKRSHHPVHRSRFLKIAACFLAFFLTASAAGLWFSAHPSNALARELQKVMQYLGGGSYSTDPDSTGVMEKSRTKRITDLSNLESVLPLMPQLFVPEYIPEGWEMESLEITDHVNDTARAEFILVDHENDRIYIDEAYGRDMESGFWNVDESIVLSNRTVYVHKDSNTKENTALFFEDNVLVQITGSQEMEELLRIADRMENRE